MRKRLDVQTYFFFAVRVCVPRRSRAEPFSQQNRWKDGLPNFSTEFQKFIKFNNNADKLINAEVELGQRPRTCGYSRLMAPYPSVAKVSWGFRDITDGECIGTGTQRNRLSDVVKCSWKPRNDNVSPVRQSGQDVLPLACWLESASNLTNPELGETSETYRRNHLRILSASSQWFSRMQ